MNLNLKARLVAAVAQFKSNNDIRYYLNGVYVEPMLGGGALIVATNGHALAIWRDETGVIERPAILRFSKRLESACTGADTKRLKIIDDRLVVVDKFGLEVYVQHQEGNKAGNWELSGTFPSWQKVVPALQPTPMLFDGMNPMYVAMVDRLLSIGMDSDKFKSITFNQAESNGAIGVTCAGAKDFFGVIMPLRESAGDYPAWLVKLKQEQSPLILPVDTPPPGQQPSDAEPVTQVSAREEVPA